MLQWYTAGYGTLWCLYRYRYWALFMPYVLSWEEWLLSWCSKYWLHSWVQFFTCTHTQKAHTHIHWHAQTHARVHTHAHTHTCTQCMHNTLYITIMHVFKATCSQAGKLPGCCTWSSSSSCSVSVDNNNYECYCDNDCLIFNDCCKDVPMPMCGEFTIWPNITVMHQAYNIIYASTKARTSFLMRPYFNSIIHIL